MFSNKSIENKKKHKTCFIQKYKNVKNVFTTMVVVTGCSRIIILLYAYYGVTDTNFTMIFLKTPRHPFRRVRNTFPCQVCTRSKL